jgi:CRISPR-associated protein Cas2
MMLVVTYDVDTSDAAGQKRLRKVAKICERYGMRVQNSVFEVLVDAAQLVVLKSELTKIIDMSQDSIRFYRLGNSYEKRIETMGRKPLVEAGSALIF